MTTFLENSIEIKKFKHDSIKIQCIDSGLFRIVQRYLQNNRNGILHVPQTGRKNIEKLICPQIFSKTRYLKNWFSRDKKFTLYASSWMKAKNVLFRKFMFREISLFYILVKIEVYRSINLAQCYNCWRFCLQPILQVFSKVCIVCWPISSKILL